MQYHARMRADLPASVRRLLAELTPADGPQLVYDAAQLDHTMREVAAAARGAQVQALFAVKSFPLPQVLTLAARHLDGFDVASPGELDLVAALAQPHHVLSMADPTTLGTAALAARWPTLALAPPRQLGPGAAPPRCLLSCESPAALTHALDVCPGAEPALRLSSSLTGQDPAVGSVQSGQGHHRSRFGVDAAPGAAELTRAQVTRAVELARARGRALGLHLHASDVTHTSATRWIELAQAHLATLAEAGVAPSFLDLGGGWHGVADLAATWQALRAALPAELPIFVEPGRLLAREAGFAIGWVRAARSLADRELRVLDLSRVCHLRWSQVELVAPPPRPGHGRKVMLTGPTCYEDDVLGEWLVDDAQALTPGEPVVLRGVTGYAAAWNTGFGGLPPAAVRLVPAMPAMPAMPAVPAVRVVE